jgi:hypothetical protein
MYSADDTQDGASTTQLLHNLWPYNSESRDTILPTYTPLFRNLTALSIPSVELTRIVRFLQPLAYGT